jgi:fatty-acid peroxygenase
MRIPLVESSVSLLANGYSWLPSRWRRSAGTAVHARLMGRHAVALRGPEAVPFFYDERNVRRQGAVPGPVQDTLFGRGTVHSLDGEAHRVRKAMFLSVLTDPDRIRALVDDAGAAWDDAVTSWATQPRVTLFDEVSRVITRAVCRWAGLPLPADEVDERAADLVATVDGFATIGPRHWKARHARKRLERWVEGVVSASRDGTAPVQPGSVVHIVERHRDVDDQPLDARTAAVEVLNVVRPTVAVTWYVVFAADAMHGWPDQRTRLREGGAAYAEAFTHELRRFYPFAPFVGGRAVGDRHWRGEPIPADATVLLDIYGQNHDATVFPEPYRFDPGRFLGQRVDPDDLIPQGGGDPATGHRCPGEDITIELIKSFSSRLAALDYTVPEQDVRIPLTRIPSRPRSGFVIADVRTDRR